MRRVVRLALKEPGCCGILFLFDSDDACPKTLAPLVADWARREAGYVPCEVVLAHREYECWFLAALESLRGHRGIRNDAISVRNPETIRGAKEKLADTMAGSIRYSETADQAALTDVMDIEIVYDRCRSFRRLANAFRSLLSVAGEHPGEWPADDKPTETNPIRGAPF